MARNQQLKQLAQVGSSTIDVETRRLTNVVDPVGAQDAATKSYVDSGGGSAAVPTALDKNKQPLVTSGLASSTGLTITSTPSSDGYVAVLVSGWYRARLGDATKGEDCFFSDDAGATAKAIADITAGDTLYWNGPTVAWELTTLDWVDLDYAL